MAESRVDNELGQAMSILDPETAQGLNYRPKPGPTKIFTGVSNISSIDSTNTFGPGWAQDGP